MVIYSHNLRTGRFEQEDFKFKAHLGLYSWIDPAFKKYKYSPGGGGTRL